MEILKKYSIIEKILFETALTMFDEKSSYPGDLLEFKEEMLYKIYLL